MRGGTTVVLLMLTVMQLDAQPDSAQLTKPFVSLFLDVPKDTASCMSPEEANFYKELARTENEKWIRQMKAAGKDPDSLYRQAAHLQYDWPLRVSGEYDMQYKYYYKGNFVDQYPDDTVIHLDYNCWSRTYNGHDASDISLWPFWWHMMDRQYVYAVAANAGTIIHKQNGGFDRNCAVAGSPLSNVIWIRHDDGNVTRYHHFKNNTLTPKDTGDRVERGEFLGYVGSSGRSSNPHLHFAVYDRFDNMIEPYNDNNNCNSYSTESWWSNQLPYWDSKISRVMTHSSLPALGRCPDAELVNAKNNFDPGDSFYIGIAFSENQNNDQANVYVYRPNGGLFTSYALALPFQDVNQYNVTGFSLPAGNPGTWKVKVSYRGADYYHFFTVGCPSSLTPSGTITGPEGFISGGTISSSVKHEVSNGDKVLYQAPVSIEFKPGFHAPAGVLLRTKLAGCNYTD